MIAMDKSLPEETKKNLRRCPGEKPCEMMKTSSLSLFSNKFNQECRYQFKNGCQFLFVLSERRKFVCSPKVEIVIL